MKKIYITPQCAVLSFATEGLLATSPTNINIKEVNDSEAVDAASSYSNNAIWNNNVWGEGTK